MLLRKDASIQLYGMQSWICLFPWDSLGRDVPERIAPLLEEGFLSLWAQRDGQDGVWLAGIAKPGRLEPAPSSANGNGSRRAAGSSGSDRSDTVPGKRRVTNAKSRAAVAQQELERAEAELEAANHRRHGLETWVALVEERLKAAQTQLNEAAVAARAEEAKLPGVQQRLDDAKVAVDLTGAEAESARRRVEAAGRSVRVARSVRRLRRIEDQVGSTRQAVERARERERVAAEDLAGRQSVLDRALLKLAEANKAEAALQRQVTSARRKAARTSLALANLMGRADGRTKSEVGAEADGTPQILDAEQAEKEAQEAKAELLAAAEEVRSVAGMVASYESRAQLARRALVETRAEVARKEALVRELEAAIVQAEQQMREVQPSIVEAQADVNAAADRVVAAGRSLKVGRHIWKLSRARRQARSHAAALEVARREAEEVQPRFEEASQAAREAEDRVKEGRGVEAEARRGLIESRRRLGAALGVLSSLRLVAGEEYRGTEEPFQYLVLVRDRTVLGSLSLDEWAHRASGHSRVPRFILEKDGEALWLYRGEWIAADTSLTLDDLAVVDEMTDVTDAPESESPDGRAPSIDLEAIQYTWERFGGRCTNCGSLANLVIDHVIPVYLGGSDAATNLQLLCRNCSRAKSHQL